MRAQEYVDEVLSHIPADEATKRRLRDDLLTHISEAALSGGEAAAVRSMGPPAELAAELTNGLYAEREDLVRELARAREEAAFARDYEYKSRLTLFGIPLVHICMGRYRVRVAKGIVAIGNVAVGIVAIGGVAVGGIALGGVCMGLLFALGGLSIGGVALGGCAVGLCAAGGVAIGKLAVGAAAVGKIAIGASATGTVAVGSAASGAHAISSAEATRDTVYRAIVDAYPTVWEAFARWLAGFFPAA